MLKIAVERVAGRYIKVRKRIADFLQTNMTAFGDIQSAGEHIRRVLKNLIHLVMALDVELGALKLHPVRVLNALAGLDANHYVLGVRIVFAEIMTVVGRDQRKPEVFLQPEQIRVDAVLHLEPLVLNLKKEILLSENIRVCSGGGPCGIVLFFHQEFCDFALQTAGQRD